MNRRKIISIGLDGASWRVLNPWIREGKLPIFRRLLENGCYGDLKSVIPPVTCPAWKSYSTGKNPGKFGVFWWVAWNKDKGKIETPTQFSFKSKDLWDYLGDEDFKVAIINMPTTYPPKPVRGIMVTGFGAPLDKEFDFQQSYTYPEGLQHQLEARYHYKVGIENLNYQRKNTTVEQITQLINMRFQLLADLIEEGDFDFMHLTIFYINVLQHFYGKSEVVLEAWKLIDEWLGHICDKGYNLIIFSDHGTMEINGSFIINDWFIRRGYLKLRKDIGDPIGAIISQLDRFGHDFLGLTHRYLRGAINKLAPATLIARFPGILGQYATNQLDLKVDWPESIAIGLGQGPIYLNQKKLGSDYERIREEIIEHLKNVTLNDKKIIKEVHKKEEIYHGTFVDKAPDLVMIPNKGYEIHGGITRQIFTKKKIAWTSGNHPKGIFLAYGPEIRKGNKLERLKITDLAPTILHTMGVHVPDDMDGNVLTQIFKEGSSPNLREVKYQQVKKSSQISTDNNEDMEIRNRLEDLGYLG